MKCLCSVIDYFHHCQLVVKLNNGKLLTTVETLYFLFFISTAEVSDKLLIPINCSNK